MKKTALLLTLALAGLAGAASAANLTYSYNRAIDFSGPQSWGHAIAILADSNGGLYFTDNFADSILYSDAPLTDATPTDIMTVAATGASFGSFSFQGVTFDGTNFFAAGDNGGTSNLTRFTPNVAPPAVPASWTTATITMPAGRYAGVTAVGPNKLVMVDRLNGSLVFLTVSGSTATVDGTVAGPATTATSVVANSNSAPTKIFVSSTNGGAGAVYVYNTNGTLAGTTYSAGNNPLIAGETTSLTETAQPVTYQQVAYASDSTLAIVCNRGTSGQSSVKLFDVTSSTGPNLTPYQTIDGTGTPGGVWDGTDFINGVGFTTISGGKYLAIGFEEGPGAGSGASSILIYAAPGASVQDWTTY